MNDEALFVLEVHLGSVSCPVTETDAALRVAFQFLDFAPQLLQPAAGAGTETAGSQWEGKSCMFRAHAADLEAQLRNEPMALMLVQLTNDGTVTKRLLGYHCLELAGFGIPPGIDDVEDDAAVARMMTSCGRRHETAQFLDEAGAVVGTCVVTVALCCLGETLTPYLRLPAPGQAGEDERKEDTKNTNATMDNSAGPDSGCVSSGVSAMMNAAGKGSSDLPAPVPVSTAESEERKTLRESNDKVAVDSDTDDDTNDATAIAVGEHANDDEEATRAVCVKKVGYAAGTQHTELLTVAKNSDSDSDTECEHASESSDAALCWPDDPAPLFYRAPTSRHTERARARIRAGRTFRASTQRIPPSDSSPLPSPSSGPTHTSASTAETSAGESTARLPAPARTSEISTASPAEYNAHLDIDAGTRTTAQELLHELAKELDFLRSEEFAKYVLCHGDKRQEIQHTVGTGVDAGLRISETGADSIDAEAQASGAEHWRHHVGDNVERGSAGSVQSVLTPPAPPASCAHAHLDKVVSNSSATQLPAPKDGPVVTSVKTSVKAELVGSNAVVAPQQAVKDSANDLLHHKRTQRRARSRVATSTAATGTAAATARYTATHTDGGSGGKGKTNNRNRASTTSNRSNRRLAKLSFRGRSKAIGDASICTSAKQRYS